MLSSLTGLQQVEFFRPREFSGQVEAQVGFPAVRRWPTRVCAGLEISLLLGPAHEATIQGRRTETPGHLAFVQLPGTVWSAPRAVGGFLSLEVAPELFARLVASAGPPPPSLSAGGQVVMPGLVECLWRTIAQLRSSAGDATSRTEAVVELTGAVIERLARRPYAVPCDGISRVRDALHDIRSHAPTMDELARLSGMSPLALVRAFRRRYGVGPGAYRRALQVARAGRMLGAGVAFDEVAAAVGFASPAELQRAFVARNGVTPERFGTLAAAAAPSVLTA